MDVYPACGFELTAHSFSAFAEFTVKVSLLLVPSPFETERVYVPAESPEKLYEKLAVLDDGVPVSVKGEPPPEKLMLS
jgi:hypothetical protein